MAFELMEKRMQGATSIAQDEISVSKTTICFGTDLTDELRKGFIEIWLDKENNQIGFRPTASSITGFRISKDEKKGRYQLPLSKRKGFFPSGRYKFKRNKDMVVIDVPEIALKTERPEKQRTESKRKV
jgi:hypothetical protein